MKQCSPHDPGLPADARSLCGRVSTRRSRRRSSAESLPIRIAAHQSHRPENHPIIGQAPLFDHRRLQPGAIFSPVRVAGRAVLRQLEPCAAGTEACACARPTLLAGPLANTPRVPTLRRRGSDHRRRNAPDVYTSHHHPEASQHVHQGMTVSPSRGPRPGRLAKSVPST